MRPFKTWYLLVVLACIIAVTVMMHYLIFVAILIVGILVWRAARAVWRR